MCLGEARGNASLALGIYVERYLDARHPANGRIITRTYQRVLDNVPIVPQQESAGRLQQQNKPFWMWFDVIIHIKESFWDRVRYCKRMERRITEAFDRLKEDILLNPTLMPCLHAETLRRARFCEQLGGGHSEPHLIRSKRS